MHVRFTHDQIAAQAARRPAGYVEELMQAAVGRDDAGVTFDTDHAAWQRLLARHQRRPAPTLSKAASLAVALLTARRVPLEVIQQRVAICRQCEHRRHDERGEWCGVCGCGLSDDQRAVRNLAAYEERLPRWGCKHPRRGEGAGWRA
jgi:hypothetical protein